MKYKVGDKVRAIVSDPRVANTILTITDAEKIMDIQYYIAQDTNGEKWGFSEDELEPVYADSKTLRMADGTIIGEFNSDGGLVSIHDVGTHELWTTPFMIPKDRLDALVDAWAKLGCTTFNLMSDEVKEVIKKTEEKKMPTKFTFYVKEGTRVDKSCNKLIPTMTTFITAESYGDSTYHGAATCDKADYNERQGCLEALANAMLGGNFDRDFNRAVKANELADKKKRTCTYCGKVFDTVEECEAEEAWHVERRKARHERYLLRKRAKEIAFEEQAQKMAKEMIEK